MRLSCQSMTPRGRENCFICRGDREPSCGRLHGWTETIETNLALKTRVAETWRLETVRLIDGATIDDDDFALPA